MRQHLLRYVFVVSVLLWIPISYGCVDEAMGKYINCLSQTNISQNIMTSNLTAEQIETMCRENQTFFQCMSKISDCSTYTREMLLLGIDINSMQTAYRGLCKWKEEFIRDLPCLEKYSEAMENSFASVIEKRSDLRQRLSYSDITFDEYFEKYCPMWKYAIDNLREVIKCPPNFTELLRDYFYAMMPEKCKVITKYQPKSHSSSHVIFKRGKIYFSVILFLTLNFLIQ